MVLSLSFARDKDGEDRTCDGEEGEESGICVGNEIPEL